MGAVTSLKLPSGFCFSTPDLTHDLLLPYLQVLTTSKASILYSPVAPTNPDTFSSIWVKTNESNTGTLEMYIRTRKYLNAPSDEWCRYYPYSIGDIEMLDSNILNEDETETARSTSSATRNYRPFAVCDGDTYGGFVTPNLAGKILYGGYCGHSTASLEAVQVTAALKTQAPFATTADLATAASRNAYSALNPLRMYEENNDPHNTAALLDAQASVETFKIQQPIASSRQGKRGVVLKRDQVPDHTHKYGWETWQSAANRVGTSGGGRGAANPGSGSAAIFTNVGDTTPTTTAHTAANSAPITLGRPHDNLPPVYAGLYRVYIGYGT